MKSVTIILVIISLLCLVSITLQQCGQALVCGTANCYPPTCPCESLTGDPGCLCITCSYKKRSLSILSRDDRSNSLCSQSCPPYPSCSQLCYGSNFINEFYGKAQLASPPYSDASLWSAQALNFSKNNFPDYDVWFYSFRHETPCCDGNKLSDCTQTDVFTTACDNNRPLYDCNLAVETFGFPIDTQGNSPFTPSYDPQQPKGEIVSTAFAHAPFWCCDPQSRKVHLTSDVFSYKIVLEKLITRLSLGNGLKAQDLVKCCTSTDNCPRAFRKYVANNPPTQVQRNTSSCTNNWSASCIEATRYIAAEKFTWVETDGGDLDEAILENWFNRTGDPMQTYSKSTWYHWDGCILPDCCNSNTAKSGCNDYKIEKCVCKKLSKCCKVSWDSACVEQAKKCGAICLDD